MVDTHFVDWYWIILGVGGFGATFLLLTAAGGTKSASERMLRTYAELLAESRQTRRRAPTASRPDEPAATQPAEGPAPRS